MKRIAAHLSFHIKAVGLPIWNDSSCFLYHFYNCDFSFTAEYQCLCSTNMIHWGLKNKDKTHDSPQTWNCIKLHTIMLPTFFSSEIFTTIIMSWEGCKINIYNQKLTNSCHKLPTLKNWTFKEKFSYFCLLLITLSLNYTSSFFLQILLCLHPAFWSLSFFYLKDRKIWKRHSNLYSF